MIDHRRLHPTRIANGIWRRVSAGLEVAIDTATKVVDALLPLPIAPISIVTAADRTHERSLLNFLQSVRNHEPSACVSIFDLGLSPSGRAAVAALGFDARPFPYSEFPDFLDVRVNAGQYAWKPQAIRLAAPRSGGLLVWMDAGNLLLSPLSRLRRLTVRHGFFVTSSGGTIRDWTHPAMLDYLGLPPDWKGNAPNISAAMVAFDTSNAKAMALLEEWASLALIKDCIAPIGSSRANHRQDQALLTVLAHLSADGFRIPRYTLREFAIHQDVETLQAEAPALN